MAGETYYFFFSIILVISAIFYIVNLIWLRKFNMSLYGQRFKPGTVESDRVKRFANNYNIAIACIVTFVFIGNVFFDVNRLLSLKDQQYAHGILLYVPVSTIIFSAIMFFVVRKQIKSYPFNKHN